MEPWELLKFDFNKPATFYARDALAGLNIGTINLPCESEVLWNIYLSVRDSSLYLLFNMSDLSPTYPFSLKEGVIEEWVDRDE
jgi:hypothetical protein